MNEFLKVLSCWLYRFYTFLIVYLVSAYFSICQLAKRHIKPTLEPQPGKVALITGGARGIGHQTALRLLDLGMTVVVVDYCPEENDGIIFLKKKGGEKRFVYIFCDLSSLRAVREAAQTFIRLSLPLNLLINNAGIMFAPKKETLEGYEYHLTVNYLSHFLLTHLLLATLVQSGSDSEPSRVVNVSSCLHHAGSINFSDIHGKNCYSPEAAYCQSKLAMVIFSKVLNKKIKNNGHSLLCNSVHPIVSFTNLYKNVQWAMMSSFILKLLLKSPSEGADTVLYAAVSKEVQTGGNYFDNCQMERPSAITYDIDIQMKLWTLSCELTGVKEYIKRS